jgi:hypothetical protein
MPGTIFSNINPATTSGTQLATLLNSFRDIVISGFIGAARPAGLLKGGYWIDNTLEISQNILRMYFFDGTSDVLYLTVNKVTLEITLPTMSSSATIKRTSNDSIGAVLKLYKARITGQVLANDVIAQITASSTDGTPAEVVDAATIEAVAEENHTGSAQGTKWDFYTKTLGAAVKTLKMSINSSWIEILTTLRVKDSQIVIDNYGSASVNMRRARGSQGAETAVLANDNLGFLGSRGHDGTSYNGGSRVALEFRATENHTPTANGCEALISTTLNGTTVRRGRVRVANDGAVGLLGSTSGEVSIKPAAVTTPHALTLPAAQGAASTVLTNDGSGNLSWAAGGGSSWTKYTIAHTALQAAALTNNAAVLTLPIKGIVEGILIKTTTAFAGSGITSYNLTVGITGNESKYLPTYDADAAVTGSNYDISSVAIGGEDLGATEAIKVFATSVGANLDQSSAGSVDIYIKTATLP